MTTIGTPLFPSLDGKESQQPARVTARSKSSVRSSSINKTSRLSVSQSETNHPSRPARSSSVTRSSISTTQYTNYSSRNTNILNTSSASVSSYIRPSTPTKTARPSTPSTRTTPSRTSTPSRTRPTPTPTPTPTPIRQNTRPSTPTSRPQTPGNLTPSPTIRPPSRSSTPTRRTLTPSLTPSTSSLTSASRGLTSNGRSNSSAVGSTSRPSSPSPRVRPPPQPMNIIDFPHETPPNLRTTLPDRPLSAGRSRPGGSTTVKGNLDNSNTGSGTITRRHSSPNVIRGRIPEPSGSGRSRPNSNGNVVESLDPRRTSHLPQSVTRKPVKSSNSENGTGFGRNISKKSLDMAIKHMDIRNGGVRPLSGSTLFPQSIRSSNSRAHPTATRASSVDGGGSENGNYSNNGYLWNRAGGGGGPMEDQSPHSSKLSSEVDMYESSRYDAILLKEDLKNTSWLHTADDKTTDEALLFDHGFESLPEPFSPL
ncbi:endochitinase A isoform X2 [Lactuca sativa]|uniref:endochitinase A isoform X2 n=1 Tax=Lactuca sativa TaxID=4236 RepID=UPI0022AF2E05|nr:endochitinase A isoform X2 [Lactuca sativa]